MSVVLFPVIPSACSVLSSIRVLSACVPHWYFACIVEPSGAPSLSAKSRVSGAVIYARWTAGEWVVLTAEPCVVGRSCSILIAFEQALGMTLRRQAPPV